ncbi:hypothetical protein DASC09_041210 [Saccharomycopsis crataegensis]|uniref:Uncharacterized protein n=1 Tax=Saccharomycopsis crataegensis TaxID=43959 RepID=A0AAV5QQF0_9ASCO|nr:hypothetical protein DASC09_041210 [Saccharomycopsis crataegensis]
MIAAGIRNMFNIPIGISIKYPSPKKTHSIHNLPPIFETSKKLKGNRYEKYKFSNQMMAKNFFQLQPSPKEGMFIETQTGSQIVKDNQEGDDQVEEDDDDSEMVTIKGTSLLTPAEMFLFQGNKNPMHYRQKVRNIWKFQHCKNIIS